MRQYLRCFPAAMQDEIRNLRKWVESGHSSYYNGDYIAAESGRPMEFINARRFLEEVCQDYYACFG